METIKLEEIELHNFGCYKDVKLNFRNKDIIGILGEYEEDPEGSNRSGKSLIPEAIKYNLIGVTRYKKELSMIHRGEQEMYVKATYKDSLGKKYVVNRGRDIKNNGLLTLDWIEKSRESQSAINDLFGVSREDFDLTCFFKQADINGFMELDPSAKTAFLMKSLDNEHWKKKEELVKEDIKTTKDELREKESAVKALSDGLELPENLEMEANSKKGNLVLLEEELLKLNKKKDSLSKDLTTETVLNKSKKEKIINLKLAINEAEEHKANLKKLTSLESNLVFDIDTEEGRMQELKASIDYADPISEIERCSADKVRFEKSYSNFKKYGGGMCPIINQECDRIIASEKELSSIVESIKMCDKRLDLLAKQTILNAKYVKAEKSYESQNKKLNSIRLEIASVPKINVKPMVSELESLISLGGNRIKELSLKLEGVEDDIQNKNNETSKTKFHIGALENRISNSIKTHSKIVSLSKEISVIRKKLGLLQYIQQMFSKTGIPADEIENAFQEIEDSINFNLKELKSGLSVSFSPDKEINKMEAVCTCGHIFEKGFRGSSCPECERPRARQRKDEISLKILENGVESDFEGDSGGGKAIISYCVRIALILLKRNRSKLKLNMLFLDEIDSALDPRFTSTITNSITRLLTKKLGFEQILMVSHKKEIQNAVPHVIKVIKKSTYSEAKFIS